MRAPDPPLPPRPQTLLLDAGNTLVFLDHEAVATICTEHGAPITAEAVSRAYAPAVHAYEQHMHEARDHERGWHVLMGELLTHAGIDQPRAEALVPALRAAHDALNLWRRMPHGLVDELVHARREGLQLSVISNSEGHLHELFEHLGVAELFDTVVDSGREGVSKPDPAIFDRALSRLGLSPADCVYVGDVPAVDVTGARSAGIEAVLVDPHDRYGDYRDAPRVRSVIELLQAWR